MRQGIDIIIGHGSRDINVHLEGRQAVKVWFSILCLGNLGGKRTRRLLLLWTECGHLRLEGSEFSCVSLCCVLWINSLGEMKTMRILEEVSSNEIAKEANHRLLAVQLLVQLSHVFQDVKGSEWFFSVHHVGQDGPEELETVQGGAMGESHFHLVHFGPNSRNV
jgi:hypothetical protein